MDFSNNEDYYDNDSLVRWNWNVFPSTRSEASAMVSPLGCLYTPFYTHGSRKVNTLESQPVHCIICGAYLNPFVKLDSLTGRWKCPLCDHVSDLPRSHFNLKEVPIELERSSSTLEYVLPSGITYEESEHSLAYFFVMDLFQHGNGPSNSFNIFVDAILEAINSLKPGSLLGLISFTENIHIHNLKTFEEVTFEVDEQDASDLEMNKTRSPGFDFKKILDEKYVNKILEKLKLSKGLSRVWHKSALAKEGYLVSITEESKSGIFSYIKGMEPVMTQSWKPKRATGFALYVTSLLLSNTTYRFFNGKIALFMTGPCTTDPGLVVNSSSTMRSHVDILEGNASHFTSALKFYQMLSHVANGQSFESAFAISNSANKKAVNYHVREDSPKWTVDVFAGSLDQVGIYEIKYLSSSTNGSVYIFETFSLGQFKRTLAHSLGMEAVSGKVKVITSDGLKFMKFAAGGYPLATSYNSLEREQKLSDTVTEFDSALNKHIFTNQWQLNSINSDEAIALVFEPNIESTLSKKESKAKRDSYLQITLKYWCAAKKCWKIRVTTTRRPTTKSIKRNPPFLNTCNKTPVAARHKDEAISSNFDQEVFTVILARMIINYMDTSLGFQDFECISDKFDDILVKLLKSFGGLSEVKSTKLSDNPFLGEKSTYKINYNFERLMELVYHLRKNSRLFNTFNSSPDQTACDQTQFAKLGLGESLLIIRPKLYHLYNGAKTELTLEFDSLKLPVRSYLVLDSFDLIVIFRVSTPSDKLALDPSDNFKWVEDRNPLIAEPLRFTDEELNIHKRTNLRIIVTQTNHSQSRYLTSRLSPTLGMDFEKESYGLNRMTSMFSKLLKKKHGQVNSNLLTDDLSYHEYYIRLASSIKN